ncbi:NAD(P)H-binding protein [Ancylomarina sp. 16SWW S1-10-2]|uniref:NAD(P)H-binding protein n=1 Tax=Ancylomarina sp. 16SWW S1-10-2 TaxID=2499681 RepID=UPI0012AE1F86|nr:NAD(P)H-binding protein [Ancylomarina sp. 16SWW S1-10-2]MRT92607.1 NAD-dependent epimerase/dehydratase family protein [Ancylomarina sp. 16SWW S1-10-2]
MKQITILGATGFVGKNILQKAIDKNFKIKVLALDVEELHDFAHAIEVIEGNYFDKEKLQKALEGSEVILSAIGPLKNRKLSSEDNYINSLAFIIKQMQANKQTRWISISSAGVKKEHENLPLARKILRVKLMIDSKSTINIKERELHLLDQSNLDWTNIRPPFIKENVDGEFVANENKFIGNTVDVNQLSDFMLAEITSKKWIKKAPVVGTK